VRYEKGNVEISAVSDIDGEVVAQDESTHGSDAGLNAALRQLKSKQLKVVAEQEDPVEWLEREVKVDFSIGPEFMRVAMKWGSPLGTW
jgi:hypothetical protein